MEQYIVYVKIDSNNYITSINSSAFLTDTEGWIEIDRGCNDKCHHAQGNYFEKGLFTYSGACRYKMLNGKPVECTAEEVSEQEDSLTRLEDSQPSLESRVETVEADTADLKEALDMILNGVTE